MFRCVLFSAAVLNLMAQCSSGALPAPPLFWNSLAFSPDGKTIASGGETIKFWDAESGKLVRTIRGHSQTITSVAFSPDSKVLVSGGYDMKLRAWNVETGELQKELAGHDNWITSVAFSPDGKTIVSGGLDKKVNLWDTQNRKLQRSLTEQDQVNSVAFSADGSLIASVATLESPVVRLWDSQTGELTRKLKGHAALSFVAFAGDGKTLAGAGGTDVMLWDVKTGELKATLHHRGSPARVAFSSDGKTLASGGGTFVAMWNVETAKQQWISDVGHVNSVAFSPDGTTVAIGVWKEAKSGLAWNYEINLHDATTGKKVRTLAQEQPAKSPLRLDISTDKTQYLFRASVALTITYTNTSKETVSLYSGGTPIGEGFPGERFEITIGHEKKTYVVHAVDPQPRSITLKPGKSWERTIKELPAQLCTSSVWVDGKETLDMADPFGRVGDYSIQVGYKAKFGDLPGPVFNGDINSNVLKVKVILR